MTKWDCGLRLVDALLVRLVLLLALVVSMFSIVSKHPGQIQRPKVVRRRPQAKTQYSPPAGGSPSVHVTPTFLGKEVGIFAKAKSFDAASGQGAETQPARGGAPVVQVAGKVLGEEVGTGFLKVHK